MSFFTVSNTVFPSLMAFWKFLIAIQNYVLNQPFYVFGRWYIFFSQKYLVRVNIILD